MHENLLYSFLTEVGAEQIGRVNSNNLRCTCPFASQTHGSGKDSNPSFTISLDTNSKWNCFACGKKGLTFRSLVRALSSVCSRDLSSWENSEMTNCAGQYTLAKKKKNLIPIDNWQVEEQLNFNWRDYEHLIAEVPPYAIERGLTEWQIKKWRIGWNKKDNKLFIPIFNHDKWFVGYSERAIPPHAKEVPKYKHAKGFLKKNYFYGEEYLDVTKRTAIIVEGFMDVWALDRAGVNNVFAYMGTSVSEQQLLKLYKWVDKIIIIPDNDKRNENTGKAPGYEAAKKWEEALKGIGKQVFICPAIKGKKDVGEWSCTQILYMLNFLADKHIVEIPYRLGEKDGTIPI